MAFLGLRGADYPEHAHREPPGAAVTANPEPATAQETALPLTAAHQSLVGENAP
jgi:hypothetical protein